MLKTANCPSCAGDLEVDSASDRVTCRYCGTTSFVAGRGKAPPDARVIHLHMPRGLLAAVWSGVALAIVGVTATIVLVTRPSAPSLPPPAPVTRAVPVAPVMPTPAPKPAERPVVRVRGDSPLILAALDNDEHTDLIAPIAVSLAGDTTRHFAFLEGRTLKELARTPPLPDEARDVVAVRGRRLLVAYHDGKLVAFDVASGNEQWSTTLGERVAEMRAAKSAEEVLVVTDTQRKLLLDLTTGRQRETREAGGAVLGASASRYDPRDRRDHQAPADIAAYRCGGVRVMGSANYSVPDACLARAKVDTDRLPGMVGHRLWQHDGGWLVFGIRAPGAAVPMVGKLARGKLVWKSELPASDPLAAQEGSPQYAALADGRLVAAYRTRKDDAWFVSAFDAAKGERLWTVPMPTQEGSLSALRAAPDRVFLLAGDSLYALSTSDGASAGQLGPRAD